MSTERQPSIGYNPERAADLEAAARARLDQLKSTPELETEHPEQRAEAARQAIEKQAKATKPAPAEAETDPTPPPKPLFHFDPAHNYRETLASVQRHLGPAGRIFSQVIHTPVIERTSESLEKTVARPSLLNGSIYGALVVGLIFYITAHIYGFPLSGSEMLVALLGGAILGLLLESFSRILRRHR